jgi:hypothetical protein
LREEDAMRWLSLVVSIGTSLLALPGTSCREPPTAPGSGEWHLSKVQGDDQEAVPGEELFTPFAVRVTDRSRGLAGVPVTWVVEFGEGEFIPAATTWTDRSGVARARFLPATYRIMVSAGISSPTGFVPRVLFRIEPSPLAVYTRLTPAAGCRPGTDCEQYLFYPDTTFALRHPRGGGLSPGTFARRDSVISLTFRGDGTAVATLRGDSLVVKYDLRLRLSDYHDGVFLLERGSAGWQR